jgi:hypothetical protein
MRIRQERKQLAGLERLLPAGYNRGIGQQAACIM